MDQWESVVQVMIVRGGKHLEVHTVLNTNHTDNHGKLMISNSTAILYTGRRNFVFT